MSDDRTDEKRAAEANLTEAIERARKADDDDETRGWVLTEYVVCYALQGWDDEGDQMTCIGRLAGPDMPPIYRLLGLVEYVSTRYRKFIAGDRSVDE